MGILQKFFKKEKKHIPQPYTFYPDQKIQYVTEFKNGFAPAIIGTFNSFGSLHSVVVSIVDSSYNITTQTQYTCVSRLSNGYMKAFNTITQKKVFLDKELKEVPGKSFSSIASVHENYFIVGILDENNDISVWHGKQKYGILDSNLEEVLPVEYDDICPISPTRFYCCSSIRDSLPFVFDAVTRQKFELKGVYHLCEELENGYCKFQAKSETQLFGYFNHDFKVVVEPKYATLGDFNKEGFAPFARDNVIGVVDMNGKEFIR